MVSFMGTLLAAFIMLFLGANELTDSSNALLAAGIITLFVGVIAAGKCFLHIEADKAAVMQDVFTGEKFTLFAGTRPVEYWHKLVEKVEVKPQTINYEGTFPTATPGREVFIKGVAQVGISDAARATAVQKDLAGTQFGAKITSLIKADVATIPDTDVQRDQHGIENRIEDILTSNHSGTPLSPDDLELHRKLGRRVETLTITDIEFREKDKAAKEKFATANEVHAQVIRRLWQSGQIFTAGSMKPKIIRQSPSKGGQKAVTIRMVGTRPAGPVPPNDKDILAAMDTGNYEFDPNMYRGMEEIIRNEVIVRQTNVAVSGGKKGKGGGGIILPI